MLSCSKNVQVTFVEKLQTKIIRFKSIESQEGMLSRKKLSSISPISPFLLLKNQACGLLKISPGRHKGYV